MIIAGDDPTQGRKSLSSAKNLTEAAAKATAKRHRLEHLFELDERQLIDLQVAQEFGQIQWGAR